MLIVTFDISCQRHIVLVKYNLQLSALIGEIKQNPSPREGGIRMNNGGVGSNGV